MKCQYCEKPATFHITELTGSAPMERHLCEEHARVYLSQADDSGDEVAAEMADAFPGQIKVSETAEALEKLDQQSCPVCGITFYEFRQAGRLGCPYDYVCFEEELEPLIVNIQGATEHVGKRPARNIKAVDQQANLIRLRRAMQKAVEEEDYEQASKLRDQIRELEQDAG